jgi:hypothetical protein
VFRCVPTSSAKFYNYSMYQCFGDEVQIFQFFAKLSSLPQCCVLSFILTVKNLNSYKTKGYDQYVGCTCMFLQVVYVVMSQKETKVMAGAVHVPQIFIFSVMKNIFYSSMSSVSA